MTKDVVSEGEGGGGTQFKRVDFWNSRSCDSQKLKWLKSLVVK